VFRLLISILIVFFFSYPQEPNRWFTGFVAYYLDYARQSVNTNKFSRYMYFNGFLYKGLRSWDAETNHYIWRDNAVKMNFKDITVERRFYANVRFDLRSRMFYVYNKKKAIYLQLLAEYFGKK